MANVKKSQNHGFLLCTPEFVSAPLRQVSSTGKTLIEQGLTYTPIFL
jgi:hypothetical protein